MVASIGAPGTHRTPSAAAANVMLCASVNEVTVISSRRAPLTISSSASTKVR
jgi:hypothetical protein